MRDELGQPVPHHGSRITHHSLEERWQELISGQTHGSGAAAARAALWALSGLYGGVVTAYRAAYDLGLIRSVAAGCRIISVGNLTVGGTGKSTTVRWLARRLHEQGVAVAVLSYGYHAGSASAVTVVSDGTRVLVPASVSGDEPLMLAQALPGVPVLIGPRRQLSAQEAVRRFGARVCVLDDAFQYWRLVKDLDVVLIDALCPFGGGYLLPRGGLREAPRQLKRAHVLVVTNGHRLQKAERAKLQRQLRRLNPNAPVVEARHAPRGVYPLTSEGVGITRCAGTHAARDPNTVLRGERVLALSSLGSPEGFERTLVEMGAEVVPAHYPDHYSYRPEDLGREAQRAQSAGCAAIVTTEKDAVKIDPDWAGAVPVWVVPVELEFDAGQSELEARLDALVT